jgi:hypothetical protein
MPLVIITIVTAGDVALSPGRCPRVETTTQPGIDIHHDPAKTRLGQGHRVRQS